MSINEHIQADDKKQKEDLVEALENQKDQLYALKSREALFDNEDFIWFYKSFVVSPYQEAANLHDACDETNKGFILKGKVQAYKKVMTVRTVLKNQIKELTDLVYNNELLVSGDAPENLKPEN